MKKVALSKNEWRVLTALTDLGGEQNEGSCFYFIGIARHAHMRKNDVRLACRSLARKGLTVYERGLFSDYGEGGVAGSGYRATEAGQNLFEENETIIPAEPMI